MFERVHSPEEHLVFEQLWGDFCEERNLVFIERCLQPERFLLVGEGGKYIGTVECARYSSPEESNSEFFYPFSKNAAFMEIQHKKVYEIGKLSINRQYRGRGHFKRLAAILFIHALETRADWYVAAVTKRMYMYLRFLGFRIEPIDEVFSFTGQLTGVPVRINASQAIRHMYSLKEFRDVILTDTRAQQLLKENSRGLLLG
ncbi:GNAT family N-acetyltransferase [Ectobacillus ponti]|uniref:GNAT family N-acetyltransferase n=1 Tax=Ectobacillus ponti TaxID=2961894 RepID=A0AA42BQC0_9BACI|nr:GNAT family N-acetyltransferase [Ectobacillus ponti]MCP8969236.1 GNAT family N-acetyltransferase [Ectobacillus ponti]